LALTPGTRLGIYEVTAHIAAGVVAIGGQSDDFRGQYQRNSYIALVLGHRFSSAAVEDASAQAL
jgi:hypothetical protein